tara:strand:- start:3778 stop:4131 length:354 start_codon:yes stop_codon:yes gene_type:complete
MNDLIKYYSLTIVFYLLEIALFQIALSSWVYDIFWLNMILRTVLVFFFSIIVRNTIFKDSKFFYIKFIGLILASPIAASSLLKLLTILYPMTLIIGLKIIADLITSIMVFFVIKKVA